MRLMATRRVEDGTMLGRDVFDGRSSAIPLLRAGVKLTERHRRALISAGVNAVYVQDDLSEGIDVRQVVDPGTRRRATVAVSRALDGVRDSITGGRAGGLGTPTVSEAIMSDLAKVAEMHARDGAGDGGAAVAL